MNWYIQVLKKYAVFTGRARRKEYWFFVLISLIILFILAFIDNATGTLNEDRGMGLLGGIYSLAVLLPGLGVSVRRLHDSNRSGWWMLIGFIPILGSIVLLVFMLLGSTPGDNQYGANPKGIKA
ncbi:MAG: DUF805 domain-containing protein [Oceanisphaera sp.]|uniref:DUF805 domain-containing protein n=1 Tax=Oceanisphaera sp. TaxID=1929979 RepID=UPI003C7940ED